MVEVSTAEMITMDKLETTLELDDTVVRIAKVIDSLYMIGRESDYVYQATFERYQRELAKIANETAKLSRELGAEVRAEELARYEQSVIDSKYLEDDMSGTRLKLLLLQFGGKAKVYEEESEVSDNKPKVTLADPDVKEKAWGQVRMIRECQRAAEEAGWSKARWEEVRDDMVSGDTDHLRKVIERHFDTR